MADLTPAGSIVSFGGTVISTMTYVHDIGFPTIDRVPVEAYEQILGSSLPVDLFNSVAAPRRDTFTCQILVRALDATTNPVTAWGQVVSGYRTLAGMPETGLLIVFDDASGATSHTCTARRKPLPLTIKPGNARYLLVDLVFLLLSDWA